MGEFIIVAGIVIIFLTWRFFVRLKKSKVNYHKNGAYTVIKHVHGHEYHMTFAPGERVKIDFKEPKDILCPYCKYRLPKMPARRRQDPRQLLIRTL
jgi:protein-disulfide isomerase